MPAQFLACVSDASGRVLWSYGSARKRLWVRSAAKPFIAAAVVRCGAAAKLELETHEIAIMAASHTGEPFHLATVRSILSKIGASDESRIFDSDSGTRAGILALCRTFGAHRAMRVILDFCAGVFGEEEGLPHLAVHCELPALASSLQDVATAFAKFATLRGLSEDDAKAVKTVRDAMIAHPAYVCGTGTFDTELITATNGAVIGTTGSDDFAAALIETGLGVAVKVLGGDSRAVPSVALRLLKEIFAINGRAEFVLGAFALPPL